MTLCCSLISLVHNLLALVIGIIGLGVLVAIHELGHFLFCKLFNVHTPSFSIGFGPALISKKIGDTQFSLSAIPFGGYVEIAGNEEVGQGEQKAAKSRDDRSIANKPYWQKLCIMCGGIFANLIFAYLALVFLFLMGVPESKFFYPKNATTTLETLLPTGPASKAGLKAGDRILAVNNIPTQEKAENLITLLRGKAKTSVQLTIQRAQETLTIPVVLEESPLEKGLGMLRVDFISKALPPSSFLGAFSGAFWATYRMFTGTFAVFGYMFQKRTTEGVGGPIMIIATMVQEAQKGFGILLFLLAFISVNLAALNLIPLPILDGGQAVELTIEAIIRRPLPQRARIVVHYACWILVFGFILYLSYKDILHIFQALASKLG